MTQPFTGLRTPAVVDACLDALQARIAALETTVLANTTTGETNRQNISDGAARTTNLETTDKQQPDGSFRHSLDNSTIAQALAETSTSLSNTDIAIAQARFLVDRLNDFGYDVGENPDHVVQQWDGHVLPALSRLRNTLEELDAPTTIAC